MNAVFKFRLYIAGGAPNSTRAVANLKAFCLRHLTDRHEIEIVDMLREPARAMADGIILTPTLLKYSPGPPVTILGSLSELEGVHSALGLLIVEYSKAI